MPTLYHPNGGPALEIADPTRAETLLSRGYTKSSASKEKDASPSYPSSGTPGVVADRVEGLKARQEQELEALKERQRLELVAAERTAALIGGDVKKAAKLQEELGGGVAGGVQGGPAAEPTKKK